MADSRDTNHDGHVSLMEKVKDKLHLGGHHKDSDYASSTNTSSLHTSTHTTTTAAVPVVAAVPIAGVAAVDSRDLNRDGHVSTSEKLASAAGARSGYDSSMARSGYDSTSSGMATSDEARLKLHEEQLAISKQQVGAGEVGIHKRVEQEHVSQSIPVKREEVTVERRPLSGVADPNARIAPEGETVRVPLRKEEIIAEKRVVPTEEVIVRKNEVTDHQTVGATLRSEHVDTMQTGSSYNASSTAGFDARDTNRDGYVSTGEKLKADLNGTNNFQATNARG